MIPNLMCLFSHRIGPFIQSENSSHPMYTIPQTPKTTLTQGTSLITPMLFDWPILAQGEHSGDFVCVSGGLDNLRVCVTVLK